MKKLVPIIGVFIGLLVLLSFNSFAGKITGRISDEKNQPLSFAIVYIAGTSIGTTANIDGMYSLELATGTYELSYRIIGYKLQTKTVTISAASQELNVSLEPESVSLAEVTIVAGEDPAYAIIRHAQDKREFYRDQVQLYGCHSYVKSTQKLESYPKRILGQKVSIENEVDSITKIFYLSESVSELYFKAPDKYKEKMISSKVSGNPQTYSFNQSTDVLIGFYDNLVNLSGLTPRGLISPIAGNSIFYYKFRLEGTFQENGVTINKISVIPKRDTDPVFTGTIYITDDTWRIYNLDLFITAKQQMEFVDTFRVKENYVKVTDEVWMPFSHELTYKFNAFGFNGSGLVLGVFSDYNLKPPISYRYFDAVAMKVEEDANKKDSAYWQATRPVPLTEPEVYDYHKRDSMRVITESKPYQDSVDQVNNKIGVMDFINGFTLRNSYNNSSTRFVMPLYRTNFNTVEGWNTGMEVIYRKGRGKDDPRYFTIEPSIRYGFANSHFNGHVKYTNRYNGKTEGVFEADAGTDVAQINYKRPISELINTLYSTLGEKNYMKLFEKQYVYARHRSEIARGLTFDIRADYSHRIALTNSSDFTIVKVDDRDYTSNNPYDPANDTPAFEDHEAFTGEAALAYRPGQHYIENPNDRYNLGSKWPMFRLKYKRGFDFAGSDVDFDLWQAAIDDDMDLGIIGTFTYMVSGGDFISKNKLYSPDLIHFSGNKTWFSDFAIDDFKNLDYYKNSTANQYIQVHAEQNFGGFFLNKIPIIRKLKLQEIAGVHFLHTKELDQYYDFSIGVEKLGVFRVELFTSLTDGKKGTVGFLFGLKQVFGN
jgi:hypothetical protein